MEELDYLVDRLVLRVNRLVAKLESRKTGTTVAAVTTGRGPVPSEVCEQRGSRRRDVRGSAAAAKHMKLFGIVAHSGGVRSERMDMSGRASSSLEGDPMADFWSTFKPIEYDEGLERHAADACRRRLVRRRPVPASRIPCCLPRLRLDPSNEPDGDPGDDRRVLFPFYDGVETPSRIALQEPPTAIAQDPANLSAEEFLSWHSTYQLQYIATKGTGTPKTVTVTNSDGNAVHAMANTAGDRILIIEQLQKTDIARLSLADQERIATSSALTAANGPAARLGLCRRRHQPIDRQRGYDTSTSSRQRTLLSDGARQCDQDPR